MVDAHCHLNFQAFEKDLEEVIKSAFDKGLKAIVNVGSDLNTSQKAVKIANTHKNLFATVGIHPHHADKLEKNWEIELEKLASSEGRVVAIGECGLDYYAYETNGVVDLKLQREIFIKHIEIANKLKLPLQIHNRHAGKDIVQTILDHKSYLLDPPGMFHCFSGDIELLKKALNLGFYIGFDGNITYKGKPKGEGIDLKELVRACPIDRLIVETDAPYLTPVPYRGKRNKPEYVIIVARSVAELKNLPFEEVARATSHNTKQLFKLTYNS